MLTGQHECTRSHSVHSSVVRSIAPCAIDHMHVFNALVARHLTMALGLQLMWHALDRTFWDRE